MKPTLLFVAASLFCCVVACNNEQTAGEPMSNSVAQKNMAAADVVSNAFKTGDLSGIDSVVAENYVDHTDRGDIVGRDSLKNMIKFVQENFKDMKMETLNQVADSQFVYTRMRFTGTGDGVMMPAGPYDMHAIQVARLENGKIVEHWEFMDMQTVMKMMPQPSEPGKK